MKPNACRYSKIRKRLFRCALAAAVIAALGSTSAGHAAETLSVILMLKSDVGATDVRKLEPATQTRLEHSAGVKLKLTGSTRTNAQILELPSNISPMKAREAVAALAATEGVLWAELSTPPSPQNPQLASQKGRPSGNIHEFIIQLRETGTTGGFRLEDRQIAELSAAAGIPLQPARRSAAGWVVRLAHPVDEIRAKEIERGLESLPTVMYADPIRVKHARTADDLVTPNDPRFPKMWFLQNPAESAGSANVQAAWSLTKGSQDVTVAVLDSGILFDPTHPDLADRLTYLNEDHSQIAGWDLVQRIALARDGDARDPNPKDEGDWVTAEMVQKRKACKDDDTDDSSWHGSHVAGTIAASTDNGIGISGIDWYARLLPVRIMGACGATDDDEYDGIYWAAGGKSVPGTEPNPYPAQVLNMSIGGESNCEDSEQAAIDYALARNAVVVVAAGNSSNNAASHSPANCKGVITVAALDRDGDLAPYSNYGEVVAIAAPGGKTVPVKAGGVVSTVNRSTKRPDADLMGYKNEQGTSMATPVVSGVISLMLAADTEHKLTPQGIKTIIRETARPFPPGTRCDKQLKDKCGAGIVDAREAVNAVQQLQ